MILNMAVVGCVARIDYGVHFRVFLPLARARARLCSHGHVREAPPTPTLRGQNGIKFLVYVRQEGATSILFLSPAPDSSTELNFGCSVTRQKHAQLLLSNKIYVICSEKIIVHVATYLTSKAFRLARAWQKVDLRAIQFSQTKEHSNKFWWASHVLQTENTFFCSSFFAGRQKTCSVKQTKICLFCKQM